METDGRGISALTIIIMGLAVFSPIPGPCADSYCIAKGLVALVAYWGRAITLRVLCLGGPRDNRRYQYA
jgi:hypothetical protein